jgi:hypothetical protein
MAGHIKLIGILHIVMGGLGLLAGLCLFVFFGALAGFVGSQDHDLVAVPILGSIGGIIFIIAAVLSLPSLICGIGLIGFRPWARILGIILSVLHLFNVPFGTALGIYGLWALLSREGEALFLNPAPAIQTFR